MFCIHQLQLHNFRSFRGKHKIKLPTEPGLFFLTGKNLDEPALGSNGAGKSTIEDAIYWALYGRTLRGLKGADVITWGEKTASVTITLSVGDRDFSIRRTQAPNSLKLIEDGVETELEQDALIKHLRINPTAFTYSVIMPQFGTHFFDLLPSQKLTLFSEIMNLDYWLTKSKLADEITDDLKTKLATLNTEIANKRGKLELLATDIRYLEGEVANFEKQRADDLASFITKEADIIWNKENYTRQLQEASGIVVRLKKRIDAIKPIDTAKRDDLIVERQEVVSHLAMCRSKLVDAEAQITALGKLGAKCATCGQTIDKTHLQGQQTALSTKKKATEGAITLAKTALADIDAHLQKITEATEAQLLTTKADLDKLRDAESDEVKIQQVLNGTLRDIANLADRKRGIIKQVNPHKHQLESKDMALAETKVAVAKATRDANSLGEQIEANGYWVQGFKRIRLNLIEDTLRTLEIEVNNSLVSLGLTEWRIEFDIERENKSGGITKGFTVLVYPPNQEAPIKWEAFSGGEVQRLRLAGALGLANLIMTQAGLVNQIEFFDEPSEHLSPEGLLDLAETLSARASDGGITIVLCDHHTIEFGEFTGTMTVTKVDGSSSFV